MKKKIRVVERSSMMYHRGMIWQNYKTIKTPSKKTWLCGNLNESICGFDIKIHLGYNEMGLRDFSGWTEKKKIIKIKTPTFVLVLGVGDFETAVLPHRSRRRSARNRKKRRDTMPIRRVRNNKSHLVTRLHYDSAYGTRRTDNTWLMIVLGHAEIGRTQHPFESVERVRSVRGRFSRLSRRANPTRELPETTRLFRPNVGNGPRRTRRKKSRGPGVWVGMILHTRARDTAASCDTRPKTSSSVKILSEGDDEDRRPAVKDGTRCVWERPTEKN